MSGDNDSIKRDRRPKFEGDKKGSFKPRAEGGFKSAGKPRTEGGFKSDRKPRPEGGFKSDRKPGFKPDRKPRTEGGSRPAGMGGKRTPSDRPRRPAPKAAPKIPLTPPRDAALNALQDVVRREAYAAQALDRQLNALRLKADDRRLAASMFYFAVENRLYIEAMLARFMETRPEPIINDILHIAAAQILFMERVPDHAAVDEAVKQTRKANREGYTGMVNGVLRNLIRARDAGELTLPSREEDPIGYLSIKHSVAPIVAQKLVEAYGLDEAEQIAAYKGDHRAVIIRPNVLRYDAASFEAWLTLHDFKWQRGTVDGAYLIDCDGSLASSEGYRKGHFSIQGQSAMLAAQAIGAKPGMQILDACAAPGGKTCLMAERMGGAGRVYAWDVHDHRVELIRAAASRLGIDNVRASVYDARMKMASMEKSMDAVLIDAPCSGLGVMSDKPDVKYRVNEQTLEALPKIQSEILNTCSDAVKPNGLLVYATCTVLPEENEGQVRAFLETHPDFEPDTDAAWLPEALRPHFEGGMLSILPHRDELEGFFIARMRRKDVRR